MSKNTRNLVIALVAIAAVVVIAVVVLNQPTNTPDTADAGIAGVVSGNISPSNYTSQFVDVNTPHLLLDVRTPQEFAGGHLANAVNIPVEELEARLSEIPMGQPVVVYCRSGNRSADAASILNRAGYTQVLDLGGIIDWQAAGYQVVQ
jgi:rhodanese-related sulfurtransferase